MIEQSRLQNSDRELLFVGTFTKSEAFVGGRGRGIYVLALDRRSGAIEVLATTPFFPNPSYLAVSQQTCRLYAVCEDHTELRDAKVGSFAIDPMTGSLTLLNSVVSEGLAPCYLSNSANRVFVANYAGGNVAAFPLEPDGRLQPAAMNIRLGAKGLGAAHPHMAVADPSGEFLIIPDAGNDRLLVYHSDSGRPHTSVQLSSGARPRHLCFHPSGRFLYLLCEGINAVLVIGCDRGNIEVLQEMSTLPEGYLGQSFAAGIVLHPRGNAVYTSNRGHNSITHFRMDEGGASLRVEAMRTSGGQTPRSFAIDSSGEWMVVANQDSNTVCVMGVDGKTGEIGAQTSVVTIPTPSCVVVFGPFGEQSRNRMQ